MRTGNGILSPITAACGFRTRARAGCRIAMAAGFLSPTTVGPGFPMSPGAGRRITTVAGLCMAGTGAGGQGRCMADIVRCGRRRMSPSWASAVEGFGVGIGFGFGGGFGSVGWLPIGPGDRFYPWYGRGVVRSERRQRL
jgi:hypothetical protein